MSVWPAEIADYVQKVRNTGLTWQETAEVVSTDYDVRMTAEAARKLVARRKETIPVEIPPAIAHPLEPALDIPYRNALVLFDIHGGYHDAAYIGQAIRLAQAARIDTLITDADIFDFDSISRFTKNARQLELNDELEVQGQILYTLGNLFSVYMMNANHGQRIVNRLNQPLDLSRVVAMALNGRSAKITCTNREYFFMDHFAFAHPSNMHSTVTGKIPAQLATKYRRHTLTGHTHRAGHVYTPNGFLALEVGCCIDQTHVAYKMLGANAYPDVMKGFALIVDGEVFHFDATGNTYLNGNVKRNFSYWERYFK